jgi:catechol 2,3-dioxygenase-like lactoylglutathione lyase family enzyme
MMMTSPIQNRIGGFFIPVSNVEAARDWYCKILRVPADGEILHGHLYCLELEGATNLILDEVPKWRGENQELPTFKAPAFMFPTDDVHASYEFMKSEGVELVTDIENNSWFVFKDPFGNHLMVCQ